MIITNSHCALVGYFITSYPTRAHGIIVNYSPPTEWIMRKPNKNKMVGVNSRFASVWEAIFNGFHLKMLLRSLSVYILKQLFFSISVNHYGPFDLLVNRIIMRVRKPSKPYISQECLLWPITSKIFGHRKQTKHMQLVAIEVLKPKWAKSMVSMYISVQYFDTDKMQQVIFMNMEVFHFIIYL